MAVPTVGSNLIANGSTGVGTTVVLTLTAAVAIGDTLIIVVASTAISAGTAVDSKGNTYISSTAVNNGNSNIYNVLISRVTKALVIGDTVTITWGVSSQGIAASMIQLTGVPQNQAAPSASWDGIGTEKHATSTAASSNALVTTHADDAIFLLFIATFNAGALAATDFTSGSVDSGYTKAASAVSSGGTSNVGVCICYKTAVATPPSQSPTFTLNASRVWSTLIGMFAGITSRGAVGANTRAGEIGGLQSTYVPSVRALGRLGRGQIGKTVFDAFPNQAVSPQKPKVGQQVSDGILVSD